MSAEHALLAALQHCIAQRITFAAFRVPDGPVTLWAQQTPELDRVESGLWWELNDVFLISPFRATDRTPLIRSDVELTFGDAEPGWHRLTECVGSDRTAGPDPAASTPRAVFEAAAAKGVELCRSGELEKIVLSRTIDLEVGEQDAPQLFADAVRTRPEAFVALVRTPEHGLWLGASPERLILAENDTVLVDALAGTAPIGSAPSEAGLWGAKELHEQRLVAKSITGNLIDIGAHRIQVEGPEVMSAGSVAHLRTRISASMEIRSVEELVTSLHPTAAVCGLPTDQARRHIGALEDRDRELYAGYWGPWSADGRMELFVNIRCMRVFDGRATLHVGAGITAGSDPASEWEETEHKADTWRSLLRTNAAPGAAPVSHAHK